MRSSFWFIPLLIVAGSGILAIVLIDVGSMENNRYLSQWPRLFGAGPEGARQMLSTLAGSMMSVMGVTFSITLVALALASNQYTSRSLRNFMSSRITQISLGVFAGIFTYCLIVLRSIRGDEAEFVPNLAVFFGFILALGGIGILIFFVHHIASSIQASNIISSVAKETIEFINISFPKKAEKKTEGIADIHAPDRSLQNNTWHTVLAKKTGYIQSVQNDLLLRLARDKKIIIRMECGVGKFVVQHTMLASITPENPDREIISILHKAYSIGHFRTVDQDPTFGIRQLVDIAMKALSPGINDTSTAIMCIDYLTSILSELSVHNFPLSHHYEGKELRLITIDPTFGSLLNTAFDQIRNCATGNVAVMLCIMDSLTTIANLTTNQTYIKDLKQQLRNIEELAESSINSKYDYEMIKEKLMSTYESLIILPDN